MKKQVFFLNTTSLKNFEDFFFFEICYIEKENQEIKGNI
jgi:hypothetical protein